MTSSFDRVVSALHERQRRVSTAGPGRVMAQCPAHDDGRPSLSVRAGEQQVLLYCFAGCTADEVRHALGLSWADLFDNPRGVEYRYDDGRKVRRTPEKRFSQSGNTRGVPTLYRAAEVSRAVADGRTVWLVEGEKDADNLRVLGRVVATTAPMGAANFTRVDVSPLRGANVAAVVDDDEAGRAWAESVRDKLSGVVASLGFVRAASGKDASDHLAAGLTVGQFLDLDTNEQDLDDDEHDHEDHLDTGKTPAGTWGRVDLRSTVAGLVAGTLARPAPTVGAVRGGTGLFYPGKVNGLAGESGAGKTWTLLHIAATLLEAGCTVVYIDHEDDAAGIVARLLDLDVNPDAVADLFAYLNPSEKPTSADLDALAALVADLRPVLVVVDSTGEGLALEGANPNADEEVAAWFLRVPRRLALVSYDGQPGPAIVVLDHVVKSDDGGLWPIGSQRKRAAISGAQYMQRTVRPFDKDSPGHAVLVCAKDRHGHYRAGQRVAELHVSPGPVVTLDAVETDKGGAWQPTVYMAKLSAALAAASEPLSRNAVLDLVPGRKDTKVQALAALVAGGYVTVTQGPRNATLHTLVKPFTDDPETSGPSGGSDDRVHWVPVLRADPGTQWLTGSGTQSGPSGSQSDSDPSEAAS